MKCVCGYEQEQDFPTPEAHVPVEWDKDGEPRVMRVVRYDALYACPACGTVRVKTKEAPHEH